MHSPLRPASTALFTSYVRAILILAALVGLGRAAHADPPPPFIVQLPAAMSSPSGIASDAAGNVYIADTGNHRVLKFSNLGTLLASWGTLGSANGQFNQPWGIAVDGASVYVGDTGNNRVEKFTQAGAFVSAWAVAGAHGVAVDGAGNLYVSGTSAIGKYTVAGALITSWGSAGAGNGQFNAPLGVAADAAGNVYVADTNNGRIQKFTGAGAYLTQWGGLTAPDGVCVDNGGHVIVSETGAYRMDATTAVGVLISQWGTQGAGNGQFQLARAVTTNANGNVYVLDSGNQRLEVFGTVTSVVMATDVSPAVFGQPVTLTATVSPATTAALVYFKDNGAVIGPAGAGGLVVSNLAVGSHPLTAFYQGDANSAPSTSPIVTLTVNPAATVTSISSVLDPSGVGQSLAFTLTVTSVPPGAGVPTGNATLAIDGVPSVIAGLVGGTRTIAFGPLAPGAHAMTGIYGGDPDFTTSTSAPLSQIVLARTAPPVFVTQWGLYGPGGPSSSASQLATDVNGNVYVPDEFNSRIDVFSNTGVFLSFIGAPGSGNGQFNGPSGIAIDSLGFVYVTDYGNHRVEVFDVAGVYQAQWGTAGTGNGQFAAIAAISIDAARHVYVSDITNNCIQEFTSWGSFITRWGTAGTGNGQFSYPNSIAFDHSGNVYVADSENERIQKFTSDGVYLAQWGSPGSANGQFSYDVSIAMDAADHLLVLDSVNRRVQEFTTGGAFLTAWGTLGTGPGQFTYGDALGVGPNGEIYVMDQGTTRLQKFFFVQSLATVADVPADQGHQVRIRFLPNGDDIASASNPVTGYEVYRQVSAAPYAALRPAAAAAAVASRGPAGPASAQVDGWDYLLSIPAHTDAVYEAVVPTLADSSASGLHRTVFFVRAATARPSVFWDSAPDSGYSVDNLPPAMPAPFLAAYTNGATALHWGRNTEPDLGYYRVYRGTSAGFTPSPASLIATRSDTGYVDPGAAGSYYALSAVDVDGNESGFARLTPGGTLAVGDEGPPAFALAAHRPNPSRGDRLSIDFQLATSLPARMELFDVTGRVVASRDVGALGSGRHTVDLAEGRHLPPGLYLVRLTQGGDVRSLRAVVLD